jgi:hypothetical protein
VALHDAGVVDEDVDVVRFGEGWDDGADGLAGGEVCYVGVAFATQSLDLCLRLGPCFASLYKLLVFSIFNC